MVQLQPCFVFRSSQLPQVSWIELDSNRRSAGARPATLGRNPYAAPTDPVSTVIGPMPSLPEVLSLMYLRARPVAEADGWNKTYEYE